MSRIARKYLDTCYYHVIVQGLNKEYIFDKEQYIRRYLYFLLRYKKNYNITILAYCIMNNHAHMLIYSPKIENLSKYMKSVNTNYAKYYNYKENRVGYVFKDRFLSEPVYNEKYLLQCFSYIHKNPVKANMVKQCNQYKYSSYNDYLKHKGIATKNNIILLFGNTDKYLDLFKEIHNQKNYSMDIDLNSKEILYLKLEKFQSLNENVKKQIVWDNNTLKNFIHFVKEDKMPQSIKYSEIADFLNVPVQKIKYLGCK